MPQVVQELVAQPFALMSARYQAGDIEKFYRYGSPPVNTGAVIGFASIRDAVAGTGAGYLKVANCSLRVDGGKSRNGQQRKSPSGVISYGKLPIP